MYYIKIWLSDNYNIIYKLKNKYILQLIKIWIYDIEYIIINTIIWLSYIYKKYITNYFIFYFI